MLTWLLCAALMAAIFVMSAQDGSESASLSGGFAGRAADLLFPGFSGKSDAERYAALEAAQHLVRKSAHFCEYALLGLLFCRALSYRISRRLCCAAAALSAAALYAVSDEVHQLFVPGRSCQLSDMLLDTLGAAAGIAFLFLIRHIVKRRARLRHKEDITHRD